MSDQKTTIVATSLGDVTVKKLALGDYAVLLRALDHLPKDLAEIIKKDRKELTPDYILGILPGLIADNLAEFAGILASATDKDAAFVMDLDLADIIEIFDAALQLNDFARIAATVKKISARKAPEPATEAPKS